MANEKLLLVTGSSGMLGTDLCLQLSKSYKVVGFDINEPSFKKNKNFKFLKVDLTNRGNLNKEIQNINPFLIIHAAAYTDVDGCEINPDKAYLQNSLVTKWIAQICKDTKKRMIFISTDFVFDGCKDVAYKETDKPNPLSVYGKSKLKAEKYIRDICDKFYIFRTAWLFGKWGKNFIRTVIEKAKKGESLRIVDDQKGCPTYTKDLSFALARFIDIALKGKGCESGIFHTVNSGYCSWYEFAKVALKTIKARTKIIPITSCELTRPARRPKWSVLDCSKYENLTGIRLRQWREALSDYVKSENFKEEN
jgi:dTDP-4-dehydrorhamnose reductase